MEQDEIQDQNHSSCISGADVYDRDALPCLSQIENTIKQITWSKEYETLVVCRKILYHLLIWAVSVYTNLHRPNFSKTINSWWLSYFLRRAWFASPSYSNPLIFSKIS